MIKPSDGMTIVELMIAVSLAAIISILMITVSVNFYGNTIRSQVAAEMAVDAHFTLRSIVEDTRLARSINATNILADASKPPPGWSTSSADSTLIIGSPATDADKNVIYNSSTGDPYINEVIYYLENGILKKRTIKNSAAVNNAAKTTCPAATATGACPKDPELTRNVTGFSFTMLDINNAQTTNPSLARSIRVTLTLQKNTFGEPVTISNSLTTKLRNY